MSMFQEFIDTLKENENLKLEQDYCLADLIEGLSRFPGNLPVKIDTGQYISVSTHDYSLMGDPKEEGSHQYLHETETCFISWRSNYSELAIEYTDKPNKILVHDLLDMAKFITDKILSGFKGGDYFMGLDTPIHISNGGEFGGPKLVGLECINNVVLLKTQEDEIN